MRLLLPAERMALTVALAQVGRGESPPPNTAAVIVMALARLADASPIPWCKTHDDYIPIIDSSGGEPICNYGYAEIANTHIADPDPMCIQEDPPKHCYIVDAALGIGQD